MKKHLLIALYLIGSFGCQTKSQSRVSLTLGAAQFSSYVPQLQGKNVALVVNQTSTIASTHLVDTLLAQQVKITKIFAPEHGFRGAADAGELVEDGIDKKTNLPIISLYGNHKKPTIEDLKDIDVVIFDIQDVGVRFYTYISTMHYVMEACGEQNKQIIVLDRPNPNGHYVAGPVLDLNYRSFVGMHPIPIVHGLTVGELASMINGEKWLANNITCNLEVVAMKGYTHSTSYILPVKPSPNLPNNVSINLYPSLCLLEPTIMSIGRGTTFPFQVIGYPDSTYGKFSFKPVSIKGASKYPKHENVICYGEDLRSGKKVDFTLKWILQYYQKNPSESFFTSPNFFDKLAGSSNLREDLLNGKNLEEIEKSWEPELQKYEVIRSKYLIYPDFQ